MDAAYERVSVASEAVSNSTVSLVALPMQSVRVGFHVQDAVVVEPRLGLTRISSEGGRSRLNAMPKTPCGTACTRHRTTC